MRYLVVLTVLLLILGVAPLPPAHAETPAQGQALGILVLAGVLRAAPPGGARTAAQKPKPSLQGAPKARGRTVDLNAERLPVKGRSGRFDQLARLPN
jgi:hypothetical protein